MSGMMAMRKEAATARPSHLRTRIYIDCDGVLGKFPYPENGDCLEHLPAFQAILRKFPGAEVVISSA